MQTHLDLSYLPCVNSDLCAISFALLFICASMHTTLWKQCCVLISYVLTINTKFINRFVHINHPIISSCFAKINDYPLFVFGSCKPAIFMSKCNSPDYERLYFQKSVIENCFH